MNKRKRIIVAAVTGALLGVLCIFGASQRAGGWAGNELMLIGLWFNRLLMGLVIGSSVMPLYEKRIWHNHYLIAATWGLLVGLGWYLASGMHDLTAFLVSILYGLIIEFVARKVD
jgi:FtsH-binding integral membrane protein